LAAAARALIIQRYGFTPMVFELARRLVESKGTDDVRKRWSEEYGGYTAADCTPPIYPVGLCCSHYSAGTTTGMGAHRDGAARQDTKQSKKRFQAIVSIVTLLSDECDGANGLVFCGELEPNTPLCLRPGESVAFFCDITSHYVPTALRERGRTTVATMF
jgi:hypothetical protein